jgi:glycosyltransferase involved in cell wall biosynthesis
MPRFSLIVPTLGRTAELAEFFASVANQKRRDIELIVMDQNDDDRVVPLLQALPSEISVQHIRLKEKNRSRARNAGLEASSGEIIAFPDDDCWYPTSLLDKIDEWFRNNNQYSVLAVGALDNDGLASGNRWIQDACDISPINALRTTFCSSLFISGIARSRKPRFDPRLDTGEETDWILNLFATGFRGRFDRSMHIHHPRRDMLSGTVSRERARHYGSLMGYVVRRHSLFMLGMGLVSYDLARALLVSARGRFVDASFCFAHTRGLLRGFILPESIFE